MNTTKALEYLVGLVLVIVVGSLLLGQVLGQPVLLSYVETGSMEPTLHPGDGFIAVPAALAGPIEPGDVVVFDAETLHGGGLTTHRVVGETSEGFITKGDANPVTDQDSGEPPVTRGDIVAVALEVGGEVVVIPNLGLVVTGVEDALESIQRQLAVLLGTRALLGTQGLAYLLFGLGVFMYLVTALLESGGGRRRSRRTARDDGRMDTRLVILGLTALLIGIVTASMVLPSGPHTFQFVSSESDGPGAAVIERGTTENVTYVVPSNGVFPVVTHLEPGSEGIEIAPQRLYIPGNSQRNATVTLYAPPETGNYRRTLIEHRYVLLLPAPTIDALYEIHPWLPIVAIDALVGIGFIGVASALVGWGSIRVDSGRENVPLLVRLRRWLR